MKLKSIVFFALIISALIVKWVCANSTADLYSTKPFGITWNVTGITSRGYINLFFVSTQQLISNTNNLIFLIY